MICAPGLQDPWSRTPRPRSTDSAADWNRYLEESFEAFRRGDDSVREGPVLTALRSFENYMRREAEVDEVDASEPALVRGGSVGAVLSLACRDASWEPRSRAISRVLESKGVRFEEGLVFETDPSNYYYVAHALHEQLHNRVGSDAMGARFGVGDTVSIVLGPGTPALNFALITLYGWLKSQKLQVDLQLVYHADTAARDRSSLTSAGRASSAESLFPLSSLGEVVASPVFGEGFSSRNPEALPFVERIRALEDEIAALQSEIADLQRHSSSHRVRWNQNAMLESVLSCQRECEERGEVFGVSALAKAWGVSPQAVRQSLKRHGLEAHVPRLRGRKD